MAVEVGDWVAVNQFIQGEVTEVRNGKVTIEEGIGKVTVPVSKVRIASRPQTGTKR